MPHDRSAVRIYQKGKRVMDQHASDTVTLIVRDEDSLYTPFSPDGEFSDSVKRYIVSKVSPANHDYAIRMRVISSVPLDEERFREAVRSWVSAEKKAFSQESKVSRRMLIGMLAVASAFIFLSIFMQTRIEVLKYTIIPVLGSVALGNRAKRQMIDQIEQNSTIEFIVKDTPQERSV